MDVQLEIIYERYGHWSIYEQEINKKKKRKYVNFYAFFLIAIFPFSLIAILCF